MSLFEAALWNAAAVVPLAVVVWCVCRMVRQPAVAHALWLLVLLKFVTPPLVTLPVPVSFLPARDAASTRGQAIAAPGYQDETAPGIAAAKSAASESPGRGSTRVAVLWENASTTARSMMNAFAGRGIAIWWLSTSMTWIVVQSWRCWRFSRRLRSAEPAPSEWNTELAGLADRLGLKRRPSLLVLRAFVPPMLWGFGRRTRIVVPERLIADMAPAKRTGLFAHELAHFCRGDHWTRVVEFVVLALFWWHPVAWWARREIEDAEEQCCDGWVLERLQGIHRSYAGALLDAIDFLCEIRSARVPAASQFGEGRLLKRRLVRIMENRPARALTRRHRVIVVLAAIAILPVRPLAVSAPLRTEAAISKFELPSEIPSPETTISDDDLPVSINSTITNRKVQSQPAIRSRRGERELSIIVAPGARSAIRKTTGYRTILIDLENGLQTDLSPLEIQGVSYLPDGRTFISLEPRGAVLRSSETGELLRGIATSSALRTVSVAPSGEHVALGAGGSVSVIDIATGETRQSLENGPGEVTCVRFAPDGERLAVCSGEWWTGQSGTLTIWNLETQTIQSTFRLREAPAACAFASAEELIVAGFDGAVALWNLQSGSRIASATTNKNVVTAAAFSPENSLLREVMFHSVAP